MSAGPLTGQLVDGRYRVGDVVGEGGFGVVYSAIHVGLDRRVALKVPVFRGRTDAVRTEQLLAEGRTLERLRHPNIVAILDVGLLPAEGPEGPLPYLVLEWCEAVTLHAWRAARAGPMTASEVSALMRPALDAVASAHALAVVHRDLKMTNILVETDKSGAPVLRVIDFGAAKGWSVLDAAEDGVTLTDSTERALSARYAAPEQLAGLRTSPATDVYSLALIWLEMVRGTPVHPSTEHARQAVAESSFPTPRKLGLELGPYDAVLERALAPRARDRFPDARAFASALDQLRERAPAVAREDTIRIAPVEPPSDTTVVPSSRTVRELGPPAPAPRARSRASVIMTVAAASLAIATLSLGAWALRGERSRRPHATASGQSLESARAEPTLPAPTSRPLSSLTPAELSARAAAAGMAGCVQMGQGAYVMLRCQEGYLLLADKTGQAPITVAELRRNQRHEAAFVAKSYGAARFTNDGGFTLLVAATRGPLADAVMAGLLEGIHHEPIGTERTELEAVVVPARLRDWTGAELSQRVIAAGGAPTWEGATGHGRKVTLFVGPKAGSVELYTGDPATWLATLKASGPFAYAVDDSQLLVCFGEEIGSIAFLQKLLGETSAARVGTGP